MHRSLALAVFIDACGWDVVGDRPWFLQRLSHREPIRSIFGFSSACVPAILTGRLPNSNGHWSSFFYSPKTSPFRSVRHLRHLPRSIVDRGRVRRLISKAVGLTHGFTGYFQVYQLPFEVLPLFDYAEKKDPFLPGGINDGPSIFDELVRLGIPYHVSDWRKSESANVHSLRKAIDGGKIQFAFLYFGGLDAVLHELTTASPHVNAELRGYSDRIEELVAVANARYDDVRVAVFSDHGMATVREVVDWVPRIEALGLRNGTDYAAVYDSTMMRFWFLQPAAEERIRSTLRDCDQGGWVTDAQLQQYGTYWPDRRFGQAIYALEPGVLLNPSHMGTVPMKGMHGYRPDHPDSDSALLSNFIPGGELRQITDLYGLMGDMARWASRA